MKTVYCLMASTPLNYMLNYVNPKVNCFKELVNKY